MNSDSLGRLEKVDNLRDVWPSEAGNFTPWLATDENIALLGDTIGIDLEVEAQEKDVGPFRADILCKDTASGSWVLIENQLEKTDHTHLGQLMTYAAGLNAVTIVWIADRFTDEHRAALDWLNEVTKEDILFFGLEVELWRIGDSPVAPKFNIVSKPNQWTKHPPLVDGLSKTKKLQLDYWTAFHGILSEIAPCIRGTKSRPQYWNNFSIGRSDIGLITFVKTRDRQIGVGLICRRENAKPHFGLLQEQKDEIEAEIGSPLMWRKLPKKKESQIVLPRENTDPADKTTWPEQHKWLAENLRAFHKIFRSRVKSLNADDYVAEEPSEDISPDETGS